MLYVNRDSDGIIRCVYACPVPGHAEEAVPPDSPEIIEFFNPKNGDET